MASLVLGAAGAALGSLVGMPQLGWMIGSALGSYLSQPDQYGPTLGEVKVQGSSFGTPIPIPYGVPPPFVGTVIWEDQIKEHSHTQGGKGGPKVTTYTYTQSYAIAICEGPIAAIVRIWKNGKLIYNVGSGADAATLSQLPSNLAIYLGTSTQLPDPTMEAALGVGNVSAYRGTVYAVLTDDDVTANGGAAWQYKFEVATAGSMAGPLTWDSYQQIETPQGFTGYQPGQMMWASNADSLGMHVFKMNPSTTIPSGTYFRADNFEHWIVPYSGAPYRVKVGGGAWIAANTWNFASMGNVAAYYVPSRADEPGIIVGVWVDASHRNVCFLDGNLGMNVLFPFPDPQWYVLSGARLKGHTMVLMGSQAPGFNTDLHLFFDGLPVALPSGFNQLGSLGNWYVSENYFWLLIAPLGGSSTLLRYDLTGTLSASMNVSSTVNLIWPDYLEVFDDNTIIGETTTGTHNLYRFAFPSGAYIDTYLMATTNNHGADYALYDGYAASIANPAIFFPSAQTAISWTGIRFVADPPPVKHGVAHIWKRTFAPSNISLSAVQSDLCTRCGMAAGEINTAALTDTVQGYAVMARMSGRAASEPLAAAYFYDASEYDGKLNFIKRGGAQAAALTLADLGAYVSGGQPVDPVVKTRNDRSVIPTQVDVVYYDPANDNQAGMQSARRFTVNNDNPVTLSFSTLVLSANQAKQIAEVNLFNLWANANPIQISVGPKWQHLTPTDIVSIENYGTVRLTNKHESANGIVQFDAVTEQPAIYALTAIGAGGTQTGQTGVKTQGLTRLELLDIPLLRDTDDDYGFYAAMDGLVSGWSGATAFKSSDSGTTYEEFLTDSDPGVMGYTANVFGTWDGSNVLDVVSTVRVQLDIGDTLASVTWEQMLSNANPCLIGSEICQFMTATLVSTGVYDLTGFLRGRKGTEWACSGHAIGERFVMLDAATIKRVGAPATDIALPLLCKAAGTGVSLADVPEQAFTNTGVGKKPYSPVLLGYYKLSDGSWQITWQRRGRIDNQWHAYASEPLGETSEKYEVDIYDSTGTTFKRTYTGITSAALHYLLADVTADGNSTHFVAKIYQIGALGRGFAATLTV